MNVNAPKLHRSIAPALLLFALLLAGCARNGSGGGGSAVGGHAQTLRYPIQIEPATLDPAKVNDVYTNELLENIYDGLVMFDKDSRIVPDLADKWDISADGRTYTFHLNPNAKFHNGRLATADDVKYSLERALWKETASPVAPNYLSPIVGVADVVSGKRRDLAGVKVVDPHTVTITIDKSRGYFLGMLAYPTGWVVCREAVEKSAPRFDEAAAVGTGPFRLADYRHGSKVTLEANTAYFRGRPKLDRVERPIVLDFQTAHMQFENGEADFCATDLNDYVADQKDPKLKAEALSLPYAAVAYITMHSGLQPAFKSPLVRRAIAMAIDKDDISRRATKGVWPRADGFVPPGVPGHNPNIPRIPYDPAQARALLAQAGYPGGRGFPRLTLVYVEKQPEAEAAAQIVRDDLKQNLGIHVDVQPREAATFFDDTNHERIPFWLAGWIADYPDPQDFLSTLLRTGAPLNHYGYSNPRFDALCDRADAMSDMDKRIPLYQQADEIAMQDVAVLPLYNNRQQFMKKPYVDGLDVNVMQPLPLTKVTVRR